MGTRFFGSKKQYQYRKSMWVDGKSVKTTSEGKNPHGTWSDGKSILYHTFVKKN